MHSQGRRTKHELLLRLVVTKQVLFMAMVEQVTWIIEV